MGASRTALLIALAAIVVGQLLAEPIGAQIGSRKAYLPLLAGDSTPTPSPSPTPDLGCQPIPGQTYNNIPIASAPSSIAAEQHPDLNLAVRGWQTVDEQRRLVDYNGGTDSHAPHFFDLFADGRTPTFTSTHRVYDWDWGNFRRTQPLTTWPATLLGVATANGEPILLPGRGAGTDIYQGTYWALVLYATRDRLTIKYGREDNVAPGYALHIENVCTEPTLLALYQQANAGGRGQLPALRAGQPFGRAKGSEIMIAVTDTGTFMDPRSRKDWWPGRSAAGIVDARDHTTPR